MLEKDSAKNDESKDYTSDMVASLFLNVIPQAMKIFREEIRKNQTGAVSIPQFRILSLLWREGSASNKDLAESMGVSGAAMSRMIDNLAEQGFVKRTVSDVDRRLIAIDLTKPGLNHFLKCRTAAMQSLAKRISNLKIKNLNQIGNGLDLLLGGLTALREQVGDASLISADLNSTPEREINV